MANTERSFSCDANFVYVKKYISGRLVGETILHRSNLQITPKYEDNHIILQGLAKDTFEETKEILYPATTETPCGSGSGIIRSYTPECATELSYSTQAFSDLLDCVLNCGASDFSVTVTSGTTNDPEDDSKGRTALSNGGTLHVYSDDSLDIDVSGPSTTFKFLVKLANLNHNAASLVTTGADKGIFVQKDILFAPIPPSLPPEQYAPNAYIDTTSRLFYYWDGVQWVTLSTNGVVYVTSDPTVAPPPGVTTYVNTVTNKIWYWDDTDKEWLTDKETLATTQSDPNSPLIVPQYGETKLINKTTNEVWSWDEADQEWILISSLITFEDNTDGTYTWSDGIGGSVIVTTLASTNPIDDAGDYFTGEFVEPALQELGFSRAAMTTLSGRPANAVNMGNFIQGFIPSGSTIKEALQALETTIEDLPDITFRKVFDGYYRYQEDAMVVDVDTRSTAIIVTPFTNVTSTILQDALEELQGNINAATADHHPKLLKENGHNPALRLDINLQKIWLDLTQSDSYDNSTSLLTSDNIQGAIDELKGLVDLGGSTTTFVANPDGTYSWDNTVLPITVDTRAASNPVTPLGNLASSNVQDALYELQQEIDLIVSNVTHTGEVAGSNALVVQPSAISNKPEVTPVSGDMFMLIDSSDGLLKKANISHVLGGGGGGGDVTNNYTAIGTPQQYIATVTGPFENITIASANAVATVHQNGQLLDPSEYVLVGTLLTVTPDIGLEATDELTVVQYNFATVTGGIRTNITGVSSGYIISSTDQTINCTSGTFNVTLPTAVGISGRLYYIKNSGVGTITLEADGLETIDGSPNTSLNQWDGVQVQSTGVSWIIIK